MKAILILGVGLITLCVAVAALHTLLFAKPKHRITDPKYFAYEPYQPQHKPMLKDKELQL